MQKNLEFPKICVLKGKMRENVSSSNPEIQEN